MNCHSYWVGNEMNTSSLWFERSGLKFNFIRFSGIYYSRLPMLPRLLPRLPQQQQQRFQSTIATIATATATAAAAAAAAATTTTTATTRITKTTKKQQQQQQHLQLLLLPCLRLLLLLEMPLFLTICPLQFLLLTSFGARTTIASPIAISYFYCQMPWAL